MAVSQPAQRLYSSVFPENRHHPDNHFLLDEGSADMIKWWKQVLFVQGVEKLQTKFPLPGDVWIAGDGEARDPPMYSMESN